MRPRFRLRTLLVLVTLCALAAAGYRHYARVYRPWVFHRQEVANAAAIQEMWNSVSFDIPEQERVVMEYRSEFHSQMPISTSTRCGGPGCKCPTLDRLSPP